MAMQKFELRKGALVTFSYAVEYGVPFDSVFKVIKKRPDWNNNISYDLKLRGGDLVIEDVRRKNVEKV